MIQTFEKGKICQKLFHFYFTLTFKKSKHDNTFWSINSHYFYIKLFTCISNRVL